LIININKFLKKNSNKILINSFLLYSFFKFFVFVYKKNFLYTFKNEWAFSEYFITYKGGFVRRGMAGELTLNLSNLFSKLINFIDSNSILLQVQKEHPFMNKNIIEETFYLPYIVFILSFFSFMHIYIFVYKKIKDIVLTNTLIFIFVPYGLIYFINNLDKFFGRKEFLIVNLLIFLYKRKNYLNSYKHLFIFFFTSILLILSHEIYLLFVPIFWTLINVDDKKFRLFKYLSFLNLIALNVFIILNHFTTENYLAFKELCDDIHRRRISLLLDNLQCWGAPRYLDARFVNADYENSQFINQIINGLEKNILFWIFILISLVLLMKIFNFENEKIIFLYGPFFGLFLIAEDFGRWCFLILLVIIIFVKSEDLKEINKYKKLSYVLIISGLFIDVPFYLFEKDSVFQFIFKN